MYFGKGCIQWKSGKQGKLAQSTGEAEFLCLTPGVNQVTWIRNVLSELLMGYSRASTVYTDNDVARAMAQNPVHHTRMKQVCLKYMLIRELTALCVIVMGRVSTDINPADLGTKPLGILEFTKKVDIFFLGLDALHSYGFKQVIRPLLVSNDEYC
jgi:hypothetical protein